MFKYHPNKMKTPNLWSDSNTSNLGSGWYRSSWFGDFFNNQGGWSYHLYHGWLYIHGNDESQLWIYDDSLGWLYTGKNLYPRLYRHSTSSWLYDQSNPTERKFWDYSSSSTIQKIETRLISFIIGYKIKQLN